MKALIGKKIGMTRAFNDKGESCAVTLISVEPNFVTQLKTKEKDGYDAVQVGYEESKKVSKPQINHAKATGKKLKHFIEFKNLDDELKIGDELNCQNFKPKDKVEITGVSKGKGFAGLIKRHGFSRGPETHGSDHHRAPGSIGCRFPQRTIKGKRMAGHMGNERVTIKGANIFSINVDKKVLSVIGSVPGSNGSYLIIKGK